MKKGKANIVVQDAALNFSNLKKKYESGSGWPSFFEALPNAFETKIDNLIGSSRTEYHCKKCKGHHGHIFDDGPKPTGKRYCNNGLCLVFATKKK
jgi:peptide-methionine (R)-S-oxide reductase